MAPPKDFGRRRPALTALISAALALPGVNAKAQTRAVAPEVDYRFSAYREDDLDRSDLGGGDAERYEIDTHQLHVRAPLSFLGRLGENLDIALDLQYETLSGASPWFVQPGADGQPVQVMSGATIEEERSDILAKVTRYQDDCRLAGSLGYSDEDDYQAFNLGLEGARDFNEKHTTVALGIGYSDDTIEPDQTNTIIPIVEEEEKDSVTVYGGVTQIIDQYSLVETSLSVTEQDGFLSDPYKLVFFTDISGVRNDTRPDSRTQFAWLTRYRRFFERIKAALHADYRFYRDDWDIRSHTLELSWHQNLPADWRVVPTIRYYSQTEADFYAPFFGSRPEDGEFSSDYRLSPYGAVAYRLNAIKRLGSWEFSLAWEEYNSDASLSLDDVEVENPGLVDFSVFTVAVKKDF